MKLFSLLMGLLLGLGVMATSVHAKTPEALRKNFVIGMMQFPSNLHPSIDSMLAKQYVLGFTQRPLTAYDADWKAVCMLCTELPSFENGRAKTESYADETGQKHEGIAARFTLKNDIFWGDGAPVTANDVFFAWQAGKHPLAGFSNSSLYQKDIRNITVHDAQNFTVHFDKVRCGFEMLNDLVPLPAHLEKPVFDKSAEGYKNATLYDTASTTAGLYNGPYIISDIRKGSTVTLARNPHWKGRAPAFDTITLKLFENSAAMGANLLSGDVDYIAGEIGLPLDQALGIERRVKDRFKAFYKPGLYYEHIDMRLTHPALSNPKVRRALLHAIDRDALNQQLFGGKMSIAHVNVSPLDAFYNENIKTYAYSPETAEKLLDEAGFPRAKNGERAITLSFVTTAGNKSRELLQQALQSYWAKIGVRVTIENQPARVLFGDTLQKMKLDALALYAWISSPDNVPKTTLHSDMIPAETNGWSGQNYIDYKNPAADTLIDKLETTCEKEPRRKLWHELQDIYADDLPALPLFHRAEAYLIPNWLSGMLPTGHQFPTSLWVENWRIETE